MQKLLNKLGAGVAVLPILLLPASALAQISKAQEDLGKVGTTIGATNGGTGTTLPELIGRVINVLLSVLGIVFVCFVVYAGFLYLTAAGNPDTVKKAKALLTQAIIGIVIIVAAYAISTFVIDAVAGAVAR